MPRIERAPAPTSGAVLPMLGKVRGEVTVSIVLGLIVSALPFVANAAFGPVMQAVADAGMGGNLAGVWDLEGLPAEP